MKEEKIYDIKERCLRFAVRIVSFVDRLPKTIVGYEIGRQFLKAGTANDDTKFYNHRFSL